MGEGAQQYIATPSQVSSLPHIEDVDTGWTQTADLHSDASEQVDAWNISRSGKVGSTEVIPMIMI